MSLSRLNLQRLLSMISYETVKLTGELTSWRSGQYQLKVSLSPGAYSFRCQKHGGLSLPLLANGHPLAPPLPINAVTEVITYNANYRWHTVVVTLPQTRSVQRSKHAEHDVICSRPVGGSKHREYRHHLDICYYYRLPCDASRYAKYRTGSGNNTCH